MAAQRFRTAADGDIDRNKTIRFSFDGKIYEGCDGDTWASAWMANGVRVLGRSFNITGRGVFAGSRRAERACDGPSGRAASRIFRRRWSKFSTVGG